MGSGLILLVIVGAWLAVLVPMGLRAHDGTPASRSAERWTGAVRVLRRRSAVAALDDEPHEQGAPEEPGPGPLAGLRGWRPAGGQALRTAPGALLRGARAALEDRRLARADRGPLSPPARRRRVLIALGVLILGALAAGQVGPVWLLDLAGVGAVLALVFLVACRRAAARRAFERRTQERRAQQQRRARLEPVLPAAQPEVEPEVEVEVVHVPEQVRPALGAEWQPVPVPLPTYIGAAAARTGPVRVLEPDVWVGEQDEEQGVFEPRRVVGGW